MRSEPISNVKMAQRLYYLAIKYEAKVSKGVVIFARNICDRYTKEAKKMNAKLNNEELMKIILK